MKWNIKKSFCTLLAAFCLLLTLGFLMSNAQADNPDVNVRVNTPAGQIEINKPPPQPIVVVPPPPPQRIVVEKPAPPPPPAPVAPSGGCHCSLIPSEASAASFLGFVPVFFLLFFRKMRGQSFKNL